MTLRYVLHTLSRVMAPTMPFFAEHLFQAVREDEDEESVHLATWPKGDTATRFDEALVNAMAEARQVVTLALEARDKANIKVRQPLSGTRIPQMGFSTLPDVEALLAIIADEINVKDVQIAASVALGTVELDTAITDDLKEEGFIRELTRAVQGARKDAGLNPHDLVTLVLDAHKAEPIIERHLDLLRQATNAATILFSSLDSDEVSIGGYGIKFTVTKK